MKSQKNFFSASLLLVSLFMILTLVSSGCVPSVGGQDQAPKDPAEKLIYDAKKAVEKKDTAGALENYAQFLQEFPTHPSLPKVLLSMGTLYSEAGDHAKAYKSFNEIMQKYPKSREYEDASLGVCKSHFDSGKTKKGLDCLEKTRPKLTESASRAKFAILYAELLAKSGKGKEAVNSLQKALKELPEGYHQQIFEGYFAVSKYMDPDSFEALIPKAEWPEPTATMMLALGLRLADSGRYEKAENVLQGFLTNFSNHRQKKVARDRLNAIRGKRDIESFTVGALLPLSGRFTALGKQAMRGIEMAKAIYNEKPGALPIRILIEDTRSENAATIAAMERLNENAAMAAIGPIGATPETIRATATLGIPMITFTQQDGITNAGSNVFRNFMTPAMQVDRLVSYLIGTRGLSRFAILYPQDSYGEQFRDLFWDKVKNAGGEITGVEGYAPTSNNFGEPIRKLVGTHSRYQRSEDGSPAARVQFDAIFIPDTADRAGMVLPQLAYYDVTRVQTVGTNLWHSPRLFQIARRHAVGAIMPSGFYPESMRPEAQRFTAKYEQTYQAAPGYLEAIVFDSMMMLFHAMEQTPHTRSNVRNYLVTTPGFPGVTGHIHFSGTREAETQPYLLKVTNLGFTEITP